MGIRITQNQTFQRFQEGLRAQFGQIARAQQQIASGNRISRPSDDPVGTAQVLGLESQLGLLRGQQDAVASTQPLVESATAALQQTTDLISEARSLAVTGLNGTLDDADRAAIAQQLEGARDALFGLANTRFGERFIFGGTNSVDQPFVEVEGPDGIRVQYRGGERSNTIAVGNGQLVESSINGQEIFGAGEPTGARIAGVTGAVAGTGTSEGSGYATLEIRHDGFSGAPGSGAAFAVGAEQTALGDRSLRIDAATNEVRLGTGESVSIPDPSSPEAAAVVVTDEDGSQVVLDFTGYTAVSSTSTIRGEGSASIDGIQFTSLDFVDQNLSLSSSDGRTLSLDTSGITRSGSDLVTYGGTVNLFDVLDGMIADLRNDDALPRASQNALLSARLSDLDVAAEQVVLGAGDLGARLNRLQTAEARLADLDFNLERLISGVRDTDIVEAVSALGQAEQSLEVAQAAGARVLQQTLLNFL